MAGHSKWANIKHRKGAQDAKRAKIFSRIVKEITVAAKESGPDPDANPRLRLAINNAKGVNMPKDNIQRAINKASADDYHLDPENYEGYGPGGVAVFVECLTDNHNRTVSSIRSIFTKKGGSLGKNGSLEFVFDQKGVFQIEADKINMEEHELELIDGGAEDIEEANDLIIVTTAREDFGNMQKKLDDMGIEVKNAELQRIPNHTKETDLATAKQLLDMVETFEEDDDVQNVYHNLEMTEELEKELSS